MTNNEAYRKGQEDMRRRCEKLWRSWVMDGIAAYAKPIKYSKRARVDVRIRRELKVQDMSA